MKKRLFAILLSLALTIAMFPAAGAVELSGNKLQLREGRLANLGDVQALIDDYFQLREDAFSLASTPYIPYISGGISDKVSDVVLADETSRISSIAQLGPLYGVYAINADNTSFIRSVQTIDDSADILLEVSEWTWVDYSSTPGGEADYFGFGTEHVITLENTVDGYQIKDDAYDETTILKTRSSSFVEKAITLSSEAEAISPSAPAQAFAAAALTNGSTSVYDVGKAVRYADEWVIHDRTDDAHYMNPSYYNPAFNINGGNDCANYVSQCLLAGGFSYDSDWFYTPATNDEGPEWGDAWAVGRALGKYWSDRYSSVEASASNVFPGNPLVENAGPTEPNHAVICVGYNISDVPIVNSHNRDAYHVPLTLYGTAYNTIQINSSNVTLNKPGSAINFGDPYYDIRNHTGTLSAGEWEYYKFTVTVSDWYIIQAISSLSLVGYICEPSRPATKNGTLMGMYEIADFTSANMLYLQPGTYYIKLMGNTKTTSGSYTLEVFV
jgi:hypothetical protein